MKIESDEVRKAYQRILEEKLQGKQTLTREETRELGQDVFNQALEEILNQRDTLLEELATNPSYSHGIYGYGRGGAGDINQVIGVNPDIKKVTGSVTDAFFLMKVIYKVPSEHQISAPRFEARVYGNLVNKIEELSHPSAKELECYRRLLPDRYAHSQDHFFILLTFKGPLFDDRGSQSISYTLLIPPEKIEQVVPRISEDPKVMLDLFKRVFPQHDYSREEEFRLAPACPCMIVYKK